MTSQLFDIVQDRSSALVLPDAEWRSLLAGNFFQTLPADTRDRIAEAILKRQLEPCQFVDVCEEVIGSQINLYDLLDEQTGKPVRLTFSEMTETAPVLREIKDRGLEPARLGYLLKYLARNQRAGWQEQIVGLGTTIVCSDAVPRSPFVKRTRQGRKLDVHSVRSTWYPNVQFLAVGIR